MFSILKRPSRENEKLEIDGMVVSCHRNVGKSMSNCLTAMSVAECLITWLLGMDLHSGYETDTQGMTSTETTLGISKKATIVPNR